MTDKVQKIREEVVEIVNSINLFIPDEDGKNSDYEAGKLDAATQILQTIDSLEESVSEDLEQAIDNYLATYFGGEKEKQDWPFLKKMAIHFANWQKQQTVNKACKLLEENIEKYIDADGECNIDWNFINDFKKRLEE